jgi:hypothetical protein
LQAIDTAIAELPSASKENIDTVRVNYVCLHLEELVGLACSAATASSDEHELYALQEVGLRLLQVQRVLFMH